MERALIDAGLSVDGVRESLSETGLHSTLITIQKAFADAGIDLSEFFSKSNALKGMMSVLGEQTETYTGILHDLENQQGFVNDAFERTSQGPGFKMKQAFNSIKVAGTELGTTLVPVLKKIA